MYVVLGGWGIFVNTLEVNSANISLVRMYFTALHDDTSGFMVVPNALDVDDS